MKNLILFVAALIILPGVALAEQISTPLVNLNLPSGQGFDGYINGLYIMSISVAALLAVIKIVIAGAKYAFTDVVSAKGSAKADIQSALLGLLLIMGAVIVLELINPRLTSTAIQFKDIPDVPPASQNAPVQAAPGNGAPQPEAPTGNDAPAPTDATQAPPPTNGYAACSSFGYVNGGSTLNTSACGEDTTAIANSRNTFRTACTKGGGTYSLGYQGDPYLAYCKRN